MKISPADVEAVLSSADNLNAALKTLLKREGKPGSSVESFVKTLRSIVARNRDGELLKYIEENYSVREVHFALLASYAFPAVRESVVGEVVEKHADEFNATYERTEGGISVVNHEKFQAIVKEVVVMVKAGLQRAGIPANDFSVYALLISIFEPDVLGEALTVL